MEIPDNLKSLYKHWGDHASHEAPTKQADEVFADAKLFDEISWFIHERLTVWKKKSSGAPLPYTNDAILSTYRFCNIFREFDRQTIEFHQMLKPLEHSFGLWLLNMFYCRTVARPTTIKATGLLSFNKKENELVLRRLLDLPRPKYGTPYVFPISSIQKSATPTRELFLTQHLPNVMQKIAEEILTWEKESVMSGIRKITVLFGFNLNFLWTEVLIDVAYQYPQFIDLFADFPVGPGALPTLTRINSEIAPTKLLHELTQINFSTGITYNSRPLPLSCENWEGVGCEFRKYTNLKEGRGRRRNFKTEA